LSDPFPQGKYISSIPLLSTAVLLLFFKWRGIHNHIKTPLNSDDYFNSHSTLIRSSIQKQPSTTSKPTTASKQNGIPHIY
jgi:hypothetical protein